MWETSLYARQQEKTKRLGGNSASPPVGPRSGSLSDKDLAVSVAEGIIADLSAPAFGMVGGALPGGLAALARPVKQREGRQKMAPPAYTPGSEKDPALKTHMQRYQEAVGHYGRVLKRLGDYFDGNAGNRVAGFTLDKRQAWISTQPELIEAVGLLRQSEQSLHAAADQRRQAAKAGTAKPTAGKPVSVSAPAGFSKSSAAGNPTDKGRTLSNVSPPLNQDEGLQQRFHYIRLREDLLDDIVFHTRLPRPTSPQQAMDMYTRTIWERYGDNYQKFPPQVRQEVSRELHALAARVNDPPSYSGVSPMTLPPERGFLGNILHTVGEKVSAPFEAFDARAQVLGHYLHLSSQGGREAFEKRVQAFMAADPKLDRWEAEIKAAGEKGFWRGLQPGRMQGAEDFYAGAMSHLGLEKEARSVFHFGENLLTPSNAIPGTAFAKFARGGKAARNVSRLFSGGFAGTQMAQGWEALQSPDQEQRSQGFLNVLLGVLGATHASGYPDVLAERAKAQLRQKQVEALRGVNQAMQQGKAQGRTVPPLQQPLGPNSKPTSIMSPSLPVTVPPTSGASAFGSKRGTGPAVVGGSMPIAPQTTGFRQKPAQPQPPTKPPVAVGPIRRSPGGPSVSGIVRNWLGFDVVTTLDLIVADKIARGEDWKRELVEKFGKEIVPYLNVIGDRAEGYLTRQPRYLDRKQGSDPGLFDVNDLNKYAQGGRVRATATMADRVPVGIYWNPMTGAVTVMHAGVDAPHSAGWYGDIGWANSRYVATRLQNAAKETGGLVFPYMTSLENGLGSHGGLAMLAEMEAAIRNGPVSESELMDLVNFAAARNSKVGKVLDKEVKTLAELARIIDPSNKAATIPFRRELVQSVMHMKQIHLPNYKMVANLLTGKGLLNAETGDIVAALWLDTATRNQPAHVWNLPRHVVYPALIPVIGLGRITGKLNLKEMVPEIWEAEKTNLKQKRLLEGRDPNSVTDGEVMKAVRHVLEMSGERRGYIDVPVSQIERAISQKHAR